MRQTVVGYDHKSSHSCDECLRPVALAGATGAGDATIWGDAGTVEEILDAWASALGLDRDDEASFDQDEFPKRVYEDQAHNDCTPTNRCIDRCEECGTPLGWSCPALNED